MDAATREEPLLETAGALALFGLGLMILLARCPIHPLIKRLIRRVLGL